ncbi:MAG: sulfate transporter CysZ [Chromatiaceae bacterium]|nr:sulfate transporter CysZ [Chromatiaceae bacterium]
MLTHPLLGAGYLWQGMRLIARPGLRLFVLIPLLINSLVFGLGIVVLVRQFERLMQALFAQVPVWLAWLEWLLWPLFALFVLLGVFYSFTLVANLLAAPFNTLLAAKVERLLTGRPLEQAGDWRELFTGLLPTLLDELAKILYALLLAIPFLLLLWVPLIGPPLWFLYTAWILALEYSDYPMGNQGLRFREIRARLGHRRALSLGFGAAAAGMSLVPVLNFILMPSAVAGATAMWVREFRGALGSPQAHESRVATRRVVLLIDHLSGRIHGELLDGDEPPSAHRGRALAEVPTEQLLELLALCYRTDPESAEALEAYLSQERGQTFKESRRASAHERAPDPPRTPESTAPLSNEEALAILGLGPQAEHEAIRAAHRRLIQRLHPDRGGSAYLAAKINEAREVLLR